MTLFSYSIYPFLFCRNTHKPIYNSRDTHDTRRPITVPPLIFQFLAAKKLFYQFIFGYTKIENVHNCFRCFIKNPFYSVRLGYHNYQISNIKWNMIKQQLIPLCSKFQKICLIIKIRDNPTYLWTIKSFILSRLTKNFFLIPPKSDDIQYTVETN